MSLRPELKVDREKLPTLFPEHMIFTCCGLPMNYQEVFGIRIYACSYRSHHPSVYVNLNTGQMKTDEEIEWQAQ